MSQATAFKKWYESHKEEFSQRRKLRYASDPEYRDKAIARVRAYRSKRRVETAIPSEYVFTIRTAAAVLNVKPFVLHRWKVKGYYPPPFTAHGRFYFTKDQVTTLIVLVEFFKLHPGKLGTSEQHMLDKITSLVFANW